MSDLATDSQKLFWNDIAALPFTLNLGRGKKGAEAHICGSFGLKRRDSDDVIVLKGTETHLHIDWTRVDEVRRVDLNGYDCIEILGAAGCILYLWPETRAYRYPDSLCSSLAHGTWASSSRILK